VSEEKVKLSPEQRRLNSAYSEMKAHHDAAVQRSVSLAVELSEAQEQIQELTKQLFEATKPKADNP